MLVPLFARDCLVQLFLLYLVCLLSIISTLNSNLLSFEHWGLSLKDIGVDEANGIVAEERHSVWENVLKCPPWYFSMHCLLVTADYHHHRIPIQKKKWKQALAPVH